MRNFFDQRIVLFFFFFGRVGFIKGLSIFFFFLRGAEGKGNWACFGFSLGRGKTLCKSLNLFLFFFSIGWAVLFFLGFWTFFV